MKHRDILKPFKPRRKTTGLYKLLPVLLYVISSVLFLFPLPVFTVPAAAGPSSMSSTDSGYGLHAAQHKSDMTFSDPGWLLPAVSCFLAFYFLKNYFNVSRLIPQKRPVSSGIRAPPYHACSAR